MKKSDFILTAKLEIIRIKPNKNNKKNMRYGIPYMGSKNAIAEWVVDYLPPGDTFVDLFAGGCSVTHCAMVQNKYKRYIVNDITDAPQLFCDAIAGKYRDETRWISREDFFRLKDSDPYVRLCWSFGNNQKCYLYSRELEPWKKALHYARVFGDRSLLCEMGIAGDGSRRDVTAHMEEYRAKYIAWIGEQISLERLQSLQSLQSLERIESLQRSYDEVELPDNAVVYCDPPYANTAKYIGDFDHAKFYDWMRRQDRPIFVSEYFMPDDFVRVAARYKAVTLNQQNGNKAVEGIYVHESQINKIFIPTLF